MQKALIINGDARQGWSHPVEGGPREKGLLHFKSQHLPRCLRAPGTCAASLRLTLLRPQSELFPPSLEQSVMQTPFKSCSFHLLTRIHWTHKLCCRNKEQKSTTPRGSAGIKCSTGGPTSSPSHISFGSIRMRCLFKCTEAAQLQQLNSYFVYSGKGGHQQIAKWESLSGHCKQTICYVIRPFGNQRKVSRRSGPSQRFLILLGLTSKPAL